MIKGGFQGLDISGVDLTAQSPTLPGGYAACAAADGKPIRVLTADGAVQCSVKKVSTNYVLAGVTGDGKILSITVGSTDGIAVSETVPSESGPSERLDDYVGISTSSSVAPYITEYDGIVSVRISSSVTLTEAITVKVKTGASSTNYTIIFVPSGSSGEVEVSCFVKKGTKLYATGVVANTALVFYPYKPVE